MGQQQTEIVDQYTHLGITCDKYLPTHLLIQEACRRLRGTFLSICNSGIHPENLNPLTSRTIYKSVVIPKALYGCEMWSILSVSLEYLVPVFNVLCMQETNTICYIMFFILVSFNFCSQHQFSDVM